MCPSCAFTDSNGMKKNLIMNICISITLLSITKIKIIQGNLKEFHNNFQNQKFQPSIKQNKTKY